jgi:hypothetical protein
MTIYDKSMKSGLPNGQKGRNSSEYSLEGFGSGQIDRFANICWAEL